MSRNVLVREVLLEDVTCGACSIVFAMPDSMVKARRADGGLFFCPNGHGVSWTETEVDRLRRRLAQAEAARTSAIDQAAAAQDELREVKRAARVADRRTKGGVCPCCSRSFVQLRRHMATKHPDELAAVDLKPRAAP